jgi:hypothetical protein
MTLEQFTTSLKTPFPPEGLTEPLRALWYAGKGDWETAHTIVQDLESKEAYHVHAFLHRQEGDKSNAAYWYSRAGEVLPGEPIEEEWRELTTSFLRKR